MACQRQSTEAGTTQPYLPATLLPHLRYRSSVGRSVPALRHMRLLHNVQYRRSTAQSLIPLRRCYRISATGVAYHGLLPTIYPVLPRCISVTICLRVCYAMCSDTTSLWRQGCWALKNLATNEANKGKIADRGTNPPRTAICMQCSSNPG